MVMTPQPLPGSPPSHPPPPFQRTPTVAPQHPEFHPASTVSHVVLTAIEYRPSRVRGRPVARRIVQDNIKVRDRFDLR